MNFYHIFQKKKSRIEICKWLGVIILLATALAGTILHSDVIFPLRILLIIILIITAASLSLLTAPGKQVLSFIQNSYTEMRRIIWPTPQETLHTTLIVSMVTVIMSLLLWGLDGVLVRFVSFITGLRL
ncbi:preprotein translocase subunit SecE [Candidatus Erwinia haradaeae]|uniref:Protein translocase subunit SecE n=1 Tax=Candidatus Erwinia haradaeae TaxID=1922217 RepID=A0A451D2L7_9GAMM|nr:preprotein translocase subunit SecE [Candidatus Erwinia haradaeae]VFP79883.1 Protein translocase subunit SecE [Candidatus Erwinia haradaeae]